MLSTFFNLFIIKSLLNTIKTFKIYHKVFNIFIIVYIATSKDKKNVKYRYYRKRGFVFLCYPKQVSQVAACTSIHD